MWLWVKITLSCLNYISHITGVLFTRNQILVELNVLVLLVIHVVLIIDHENRIFLIKS